MNTSYLIIRPNTSDSASFRQIFTEEELFPISLPSNALFLDCGAYVGYSSFYLLSKFPSSRVLSVEPDHENFQILGLNLREFVEQRRAALLQCAVWSELSTLAPSALPFRDDREWSRSFEPYHQERPALSYLGLPVPTLLNTLSPSRQIDLFKMDVEGAETLIFALTTSNDLSWLDRINQIAIELHDDSPYGPATPIFLAAIKDRGFELSKSGELTIARRKSITSYRSTK